MIKKRHGMVALLLAVMMLVASQEYAFAAVHNWGVVKSPGTTTSSTLIKMPLYKGDIKFTVTSLTGNCSYLIGQCESGESGYYYVNNAARAVKISLVGGSDTFRLAFINNGDLKDSIYLKCSVQHNASIGQEIRGTGTISY